MSKEMEPITEESAGIENVVDNETSTTENNSVAELSVEEKLNQLEQEYAKLKINSRKWEDRAKADEEPAKKYREWVKSQKPEQERLEEELATAKAELENLRLEKVKTSIIAKKGLPVNEEILSLLSGKQTEEELEAAADAILLLIQKETQPKTPKPVSEQGKPANATANTAQLFANALGNVLK